MLQKHSVAVTAYMPLAKGRVVGDPVLKRIGAAHGASENQVSLAWLMQQGVIVIPASGSRNHLESNFARAMSVSRMPTWLRSKNSTAASGSSIRPNSPEWD